MNDAAEPLEVIGQHQDGASSHERQERPAELGNPSYAKSQGSTETEHRGGNERALSDLSPQRPIVQLVQGMSGNAYGQKEGTQRRDQTREVKHRRQTGADHHV